MCALSVSNQKNRHTALVLGHDVSRGVGRRAHCAHSVAGDHSELKAISSRKAGDGELRLTDVSEVAAQPFGPALTSLYTVAHDLTASISLGNVPLQCHRVSGHINAVRSSRWI